MNIQWIGDATWIEMVLLLIAFMLSTSFGIERERRPRNAEFEFTLVDLGPRSSG